MDCCGILSLLLRPKRALELCERHEVVHVNKAPAPKISDGVYTSPSTDRIVCIVDCEPVSFKYVLDSRWHPITEEQGRTCARDYKSMRQNTF